MKNLMHKTNNFQLVPKRLVALDAPHGEAQDKQMSEAQKPLDLVQLQKIETSLLQDVQESGQKRQDMVANIGKKLADKNTDLSLIDVQFLNRHKELKIYVASNPRAPRDLLQTLAFDTDVLVCAKVAENLLNNPNDHDSLSLLTAMAIPANTDRNVRALIARRASDPALLALLDRDEDATVIDALKETRARLAKIVNGQKQTPDEASRNQLLLPIKGSAQMELITASLRFDNLKTEKNEQSLKAIVNDCMNGWWNGLGPEKQNIILQGGSNYVMHSFHGNGNDVFLFTVGLTPPFRIGFRKE